MPHDCKVPELGENIESGTVVKVLVKQGDRIALQQAVVELETGKAVLEVPSDQEGVVETIHVKAGDEVRVGQPLITIREEKTADKKEPEKPAAQPAETAQPPSQPAGQPQAPPQPRQPPVETKTESLPPAAAPSVRRIARELGVDIASVKGSGPRGRISEEDVRKAQTGKKETPPAPAKTDRPSALPDFSRWGDVERKPMGPVRRLTARKMSQAWAAVPNVAQFGRADVTAIETLRLRHKDEAEKAGGHLSLTVILVKALAGALKAFPAFNSSVDMENGEILYKHYYNIGIAMDTPRGLVAPVLKNVERKNLIELAAEFKALTARARDGKLAADDLEGGSFTVTNAGALGGDAFIPIVNWPETAILAVGKTRMEPVWQDNAFQPKPLLPLTLCYDHRVIDGADGVRFMLWLVAALEDPISLLWKG